jgi:hypothetical protein
MTVKVDSVDETNRLKYGLKHAIYYTLLRGAKILEGEALTRKGEETTAHEMASFIKVIKHHENIVFADAKYCTNKARQERLRLPDRTPDEDAMQTLRTYTVDRIQEICEGDVDKSMYIELRNLTCSRLTIFSARRGGEPARMCMSMWTKRNKWLKKGTFTALDEGDKLIFKEMHVTFVNGKGNHLVSCFLPKDCWKALDILCDPKLRRDMTISDNNKFLFANTEQSTHHTDGWAATNYTLKKAGLDKYAIINATNQRGRISTLYAALDVPVNDRPYFYKHLGHSEAVNAGTYQRPLAVEAILKVGSILCEIERPSTSSFPPLSSVSENTVCDVVCYSPDTSMQSMSHKERTPGTS